MWFFQTQLVNNFYIRNKNIFDYKTLWILFIISVTFIISSCFTDSDSSLFESKIVNGIEVDVEMMRYLVSLKTNHGRIFCTGSLIDKKHILTTAKCIFKYLDIKIPELYDGIYAVLGITNNGENGKVHSIKHLDVYDYFVPGSDKDIGLVTVSNFIR